MLIPLLYGQGRARYGQILSEAARLVDAGKLRPLMDQERFGYSEAGQAHARLEAGQAIGKIVLVNDLN